MKYEYVYSQPRVLPIRFVHGEKQQHDRERIEVRKRLEVLETTSSVEGAGDGEQAAQRSTQLAKLEVRIVEHGQHCLETLQSLEKLTK
ncbi:hypothetical protein OUZ56_033665 [Daphnia magna]|uniref:Uncharacterized protein n=1 Tax=Daphnia magna TaxID=35525 RepID=A0ABR0BAZ3_9CRUS|nr:hypothetical protein OUZ56_033665 [Daphnia magna]